jgi:uncharacterized protein YndB with AHSA1/START domain
MEKTFEGYLLIADITGYTMFLSQSELDHAQEILTVLLELLLDHTRPPLVLSRLAGDAVISYGLNDHFYQGQTFLEMIEDTYVAFRKAIEQMMLNTTCRCKACANISSLDLKFFVHYGSFAIQHIVDHDELVGNNVNLIHRLLKNHVTEQTHLSAYTLYTSQAIEHLNLPGLVEILLSLEETYEHLGTVQIWVKDMHPVWEKRHAAMHVMIQPDQRLGQFETEIAMPADRVWDYLIQPQAFNSLIHADRLEVSHLSHGRVDTGTVYRCVHGKRTTPLTILEWRPFERILMQCAMPIPGCSALMEMRLVPSPNGTRIFQIFSKSTGPLLGRLVNDLMMKGMAKRFKEDLEAFRRDIEADLGNRAVALPDFIPATGKVTKETMDE